MLILTRRTGEEILIDQGQIQIKVLFARNGNVAIGINAPRQIAIDRKEIYLKKQRAKLLQNVQQTLEDITR